MKNTGTLAVATPTPKQIVLTRVFNAPLGLVFDAFTKPDLLRRWFGPRDWSLIVCEVDFRVGGGFRFILRSPEGNQMGMRGTYREINAPYRSAHTEIFDDLPGESEVITELTQRDGTTLLTATITYTSREIRDAIIRSGMEHGAAESYDRLAELLELLTPAKLEGAGKP
ncbi:MAG: ATPase [Acidobacteriales bacterium 59-55]|nr:SRPBCC family protein [Terriglobales bacterium]OJV44487.1 MAG: ATPase [Acidobacteriales bacterium 59-55]